MKMLTSAMILLLLFASCTKTMNAVNETTDAAPPLKNNEQSSANNTTNAVPPSKSDEQLSANNTTINEGSSAPHIEIASNDKFLIDRSTLKSILAQNTNLTYTSSLGSITYIDKNPDTARAIIVNNFINELMGYDYIYEIMGTEHEVYTNSDRYMIKLWNEHIICKINAVDKNKSGLDLESDYDIIWIDVEKRTHTVLFTDKYYRTMILPVLSPGTKTTMTNGDMIAAETYNFAIIKIPDGNIYLLRNKYTLLHYTYDHENKKFIFKEYAYENSQFPDYINIINTPHYLLVEHAAMTSGEEYTSINKQTGSFTLFDSRNYRDRGW